MVVVFHALLGYALVSGLARDALKFIKKPLEAAVIQEVIIPPPPPPPPKEIVKQDPTQKPPETPPFQPPPDNPSPVVSDAPTIAVVTAPPPTPVAIAPPPPAPVPLAPPKVNRSDIAVACPTQVKPEMPRKALQEGISGVVKAQAVIKGGVVRDVTILSGPRIYHAAVKAAMMQYKCVSDGGDEILATQEFNFKLDE